MEDEPYKKWKPWNLPPQTHDLCTALVPGRLTHLVQALMELCRQKILVLWISQPLRRHSSALMTLA